MASVGMFLTLVGIYISSLRQNKSNESHAQLVDEDGHIKSEPTDVIADDVTIVVKNDLSRF